ncbi:MAG: hypothetical protein K8R88_09320 [Armatimonadetes bacterium]|nr:hypothetical protein [Armatimonadota bacterium]
MINTQNLHTNTGTIVASFVSVGEAEQAIGAIMDHGLNSDYISVVTRAPEPDRAVVEMNPPVLLGDPSGSMASYATPLPDFRSNAEMSMDMAEHGITVTTPADAASGAAKGAGIGLGVGALAALAAVTLPGIGIVLGGGALALAAAGAASSAAAGAVAGGVFGYLKDQNVPSENIEHYESAVHDGGAVLTLNIPMDMNKETEFLDVIRKYGGVNITNIPHRAPM